MQHDVSTAEAVWLYLSNKSRTAKALGLKVASYNLCYGFRDSEDIEVMHDLPQDGCVLY